MIIESAASFRGGYRPSQELERQRWFACMELAPCRDSEVSAAIDGWHRFGQALEGGEERIRPRQLAPVEAHHRAELEQDQTNRAIAGFLGRTSVPQRLLESSALPCPHAWQPWLRLHGLSACEAAVRPAGRLFA